MNGLVKLHRAYVWSLEKLQLIKIKFRGGIMKCLENCSILLFKTYPNEISPLVAYVKVATLLNIRNMHLVSHQNNHLSKFYFWFASLSLQLLQVLKEENNTNYILCI